MAFSLLSVMTAVSIFFGSFAISPVSGLKIDSGELIIKIDTQLNKPLDEEIANEFLGISLDNLGAQFDIRYKMNEDQKKLDIQCDMDLRNGDDDSLQMSLWANLDFSDKNVPKALLIFKHQYDEKFNVINMQYPTAHSGMNAKDVFGQVMDSHMMNRIYENVSVSLKENDFSITEKDGHSTAIMDEETLKDVIKQIALGVGEYLATYFGMGYVNYNDESYVEDTAVIGSADGPTSTYVSAQNEIETQIKASINEFFQALGGVKVFDEEALVFNMTVDDKNQPKNINYIVNINTNMYDLIEAFGGYKEDLVREKADIDMSITFDYNYSNVNDEIVINYPALTGENSIDIMPEYSLPEIDVNAVNIVVNDNFTPTINKPFIREGVVYLPLREILNLKGVSDEDIVWDNGIIKTKLPQFSAELTTGSSEIVVRGQKVNTGHNVLLINDTTFIPVSVFYELGLGGMTNTFYDDENNIIGCVIYMNKYTHWDTGLLRFLISESNEEWEEYLYKASDMAGAKMEIVYVPEEHYREYTNLVIASGDPMVAIGKYSDEFVNQMTEMGAIYPAIKVNDEYSALVLQTVRDADLAMEIVKNFISMVME